MFAFSFATTFNYYCLVFLYNIFISLYFVLVRFASLWNGKAKQWIKGRKNTWDQLGQMNFQRESTIWIHASSAGEFEQAKPVIEALKRNYPDYKILVSFFSPSGYNVAGNYKHADYIFYLPLDTAGNAKRFIETIEPRLIIFVKYDFWYHYLSAIHSRKFPLLLISAVFRREQAFFKWYGIFYRKMLQFFDMIFVQDETSLNQLNKYNIHHCRKSGDTRFDRVSQIAEGFTDVPFMKEFVGNKKTLVAGSTWPDDEKLIKDGLLADGMKLIIAPHEIHTQHIDQLKKDFPDSVLYSEIKNALPPDKKVLIIDNVGMLSRLYHYATFTYVGGGFTKDGIHNILEAAVYGKPVVFGPNFQKYREATELIGKGGAFSASTAEQLSEKIESFLSNEADYNRAGNASFKYINQHKGATEKIINYIQEKRLLTN